jgi:hypothetical protein
MRKATCERLRQSYVFEACKRMHGKWKGRVRSISQLEMDDQQRKLQISVEIFTDPCCVLFITFSQLVPCRQSPHTGTGLELIPIIEHAWLFINFGRGSTIGTLFVFGIRIRSVDIGVPAVTDRRFCGSNIAIASIGDYTRC